MQFPSGYLRMFSFGILPVCMLPLETSSYTVTWKGYMEMLLSAVTSWSQPSSCVKEGTRCMYESPDDSSPLLLESPWAVWVFPGKEGPGHCRAEKSHWFPLCLDQSWPMICENNRMVGSTPAVFKLFDFRTPLHSKIEHLKVLYFMGIASMSVWHIRK